MAPRNSSVEPVPVFLQNRCCIPPQSEMSAQVESVKAPTVATAARIEPLIVTVEDIESLAVPEAFQFMILIVARTVCHWSTTDKTTVVQSRTRPINTYTCNGTHC